MRSISVILFFISLALLGLLLALPRQGGAFEVEGIEAGWIPQETYAIEWGPLDTEASLELDLLRGDQVVRQIASDLDDHDQVNWQVPGDIIGGSDYRVRLRGGGIELESPAFSIAPADANWAVNVISSQGGGPDGVRLVDVNGDGLLDVVTAYESSGAVQIMTHPDYEHVEEEWPSILAGNAPRGEDAFAVDLDGDGSLDVVSSHEGDEMALYVHWAPGPDEDYRDPELWTTDSFPDSHGISWMYAIAIDMNHDGRLDVLAGAKDDYLDDRNSVGEIGWFEAPGESRNLSKWTYHKIDHTGLTMSIIPYDIDADGDMDILISDRNADEEHMGARWLENPGDAKVNEWPSHFLGKTAGDRVAFMDMGDLDGDGVPEIVIPIQDSTRVAILRRDPDSEDPEYKTYWVDLSDAIDRVTFKGARIGDIDLDGQPDIALTIVTSSTTAGWISFEGSPFDVQWTWHNIYDEAETKMDQASLYDVDGDGDLDLISTEENTGLGVIWFENPVIDLDD